MNFTEKLDEVGDERFKHEKERLLEHFEEEQNKKTKATLSGNGDAKANSCTLAEATSSSEPATPA